MPIPLLWLGASIAAAYAGSQIVREQQKSAGHVGHFPGEHKVQVTPIDGCIVCCGIYELFQHTGIWVDGHIIELRGNGLVRGISPDRFLQDRSGNRIYVACDGNMLPIASEAAIERSVSRLYEYSPYHVIKNNCHRFVQECITGVPGDITRFGQLNALLHEQYQTEINWLPISSA